LKYRIIQDHVAEVQPWFRLEVWKDPLWLLETSGRDVEKLRARLAKLANPPPQAFTVIEEREL
jgi:hypothetical protein